MTNPEHLAALERTNTAHSDYLSAVCLSILEEKKSRSSQGLADAVVLEAQAVARYFKACEDYARLLAEA